MDRFLAPARVTAYATGLCPSTLRSLVRRGKLARHDGLYDLDEVLEWLGARRSGGHAR